MKKLLSYLIAMMLTLSLAFVAVACDPTDDGDADDVETGFKYELVTEVDDGEDPFYKITGFGISNEDAEKIADGDYSSVASYREITIPTSYTELDGATENYAVKEIDMSAFANQPLFTKITVGSNIKKIGEGAFAGCSNLTELVLPFVGSKIDAVNEERMFGYIFGNTATENSTSVTGKLHQRVDETGTVISSEEDLTYSVPTSLKKVTIVNSATNIASISECAFYGMTMLEEVIIPATVETIENHAFYGCTSLIKMELPKTVKEIGDYAFTGNTALYRVEFANDSVLEVIGAHAFEGCSLLNSSKVQNVVPLDLPVGVKEIGEYAFNGCTSIKEINLSKLTNLQVLETGVFANCTNVIKVTVKNGLTYKNGAFNGCTNLEKAGVVLTEGAFDFAGVNKFAFDFEI